MAGTIRSLAPTEPKTLQQQLILEKATMSRVLSTQLVKTCVVTNGSGTISANVANVNVNCVSSTHTVGGMVSGLTGTLVLQNNGGGEGNIQAPPASAINTPLPS